MKVKKIRSDILFLLVNANYQTFPIIPVGGGENLSADGIRGDNDEELEAVELGCRWGI